MLLSVIYTLKRGGEKMRILTMRNILFLFLGVLLAAGQASALTVYQLDAAGNETLIPTNWSIYAGSPAGSVVLVDKIGNQTDWKVLVGYNDFGDAEFDTQQQAIYAAGTLLQPAYGYKVVFDVDAYGWDSYNTNVPAPGFTGYWDLVSVNLNQTNYYWNLVQGGAGALTDPLVTPDPAGNPVISFGPLPGITWGWGGLDYGNHTFEEVHGLNSIQLIGSPDDYFLSVALDTATTPHTDMNYPSYAGFNAPGDVPPPIPEPSTFLLISAGLAGVGLLRKRFRK